MPSIVVRATSTASSSRSRGTTSRDVIAQPWPECDAAAYAQNNPAIPGSPSSSMTDADLPPSARNPRFSDPLAAAMIRRPTGVDAGTGMTSTAGWVVSSAPTGLSDDVTPLTTPAGMSVDSLMSLPSASAAHGVSGAPLSTTVQPAASAGASFASASWIG